MACMLLVLRRSELGEAMRACRGAFVGVGLISGMINVLYLTGSFFMLEVYDRVLPSRSIPTLVGLSMLALASIAFQGVLDLIRGAHPGAHRHLARRGAERARLRRPSCACRSRRRPATTACSRCATSTRSASFLSGIGPTALFDLPWMPLYLAICFLFHP